MTNYLIVSVFRPETAATNFDSHKEALDLFENATEVVGVYEGQEELSIMVPWTLYNEATVQELCATYNQDCYLSTTKNKYGYLFGRNGNPLKSLGKYKVTDTAPEGDYTKLSDTQYLSFA